MSWIIPYKSTDFRWNDPTKYMIIDIRDPASYASGHIPYAINKSITELYNEAQVEIASEEEYNDLKARTDLETPGANILPIYTDLTFDCGDTPITQEALVRACKDDYTFFRLSIVTPSFDFQGKMPVIVSYTCEDSIQAAMGVMRATYNPVIVIRGGMLEWVASGLPVI